MTQVDAASAPNPSFEWSPDWCVCTHFVSPTAAISSQGKLCIAGCSLLFGSTPPAWAWQQKERVARRRFSATTLCLFGLAPLPLATLISHNDHVLQCKQFGTNLMLGSLLSAQLPFPLETCYCHSMPWQIS